MTYSSKYLVSQLTKEISSYFGNRSFFACIYGSHATGKNNENSDIDVLIATAKYSQEDLTIVKGIILEFHRTHKLHIDNEVPYDNKLLISYKDLNHAANLNGFIKKGDTIIIPQVVKDKKYLESKKVKLRLALNALTSPHIMFGNDEHMYAKIKEKAEKNIAKLSISKQKNDTYEVTDLVNALLTGDNGEEGELYLGYKNYPSVVRHLTQFLNKQTKLNKTNNSNRSLSATNKEKIFIGVAWPYVNGNLHIGHVAGYLLPADISARFFRLIGSEVLMVSGSDCFGTPITVEADKKNVLPEDIVEIYHARNLDLFSKLSLSFDLYTKTTTDNHKKITQGFLKAFWHKGLIEIKTNPQYYSPVANKFLPDRYVEGTCPNCGYKESRGDQCDGCGSLLDQNLIDPISKIDKSKVVLKNTQHLFICWDKLQAQLEEYVKSRKGWRKWVKKETMNWLKEGLKSRAVTRDLDWGVEIPEEIAKHLENSKSKRIYVWFDAVIGYLSASVEWSDVNKTDWRAYWYDKDVKHYYFMGKDNLVFHTIFWPGQLISYDPQLHLPDYPAINQYLSLEGSKFSKSRGVIIDTADFISKFGSDSLRFYLTTIMPENADTNFVWEDFFKKNNDILVGHLGNYIHRTLSLYKNQPVGADITLEVVTKIEQALKNSIKYLRRSEFKNYYLEIESLAKFANGYFNQSQPWVTKKSDLQKFKKDGAGLIILTYAIACLLEPITPIAVQKYFKSVGVNENLLWKNQKNLKVFLKEQILRMKINTVAPLFPKFDQIALNN
jgi:methionyl-tRNA synthetase